MENLQKSEVRGKGFAGGALGLGKKAVGYLGGAPISGLNIMGGKSTLMARTRAGAGRFGEAIGARPIGAEAVADQARVEAAAKLSTAAFTSGNETDKARIENLAVNGAGIEKAGALQAIVNEKKLHKIKAFQNTDGSVNFDEVNKAVTDAERFGASRNVRKNVEKSMPAFAAYNKDTVDELAGRLEKDGHTRVVGSGKINPVTGAQYTVPDAQREAVRRAHAEMGVMDIRALPAPQMTKDFVTDSNTGTLQRAGLEFSKEQKDELKKVIPTLTTDLTNALGLRAGADAKAIERAMLNTKRANPTVYNRAREINEKIATINNF